MSAQSIIWHNGLPIPTGIRPINMHSNNTTGLKNKDAISAVDGKSTGSQVRTLVERLINALQRENIPDPATYVQEVVETISTQRQKKSLNKKYRLGRQRVNTVNPLPLHETKTGNKVPKNEPGARRVYKPQSSTASTKSRVQQRRPQSAVARTSSCETGPYNTQHKVSRIPLSARAPETERSGFRNHSKLDINRPLANYLEERSRYYKNKYGEAKAREATVDTEQKAASGNTSNSCDGPSVMNPSKPSNQDEVSTAHAQTRPPKARSARDENESTTSNKQLLVPDASRETKSAEIDGEFIVSPPSTQKPRLRRPASARMLRAYQKDIDRRRKSREDQYTQRTRGVQNSTAYLRRDPNIPVREKASIGKHIKRQVMHRKYSMEPRNPLPTSFIRAPKPSTTSRNQRGSKNQTTQPLWVSYTTSSATEVLTAVMKIQKFTKTVLSKRKTKNCVSELEDFDRQCRAVEVHISNDDDDHSLSSVEGEFILD